ncbi:unnamed protein product [Oppiella nova]|uniref:Uncharacterized protein n=1 Tax=Oppiella nova TaxID=334625 RepID=A0A7R9QHL4_9ACAR|nr:unnamed protein product [Oppiella nova]CAG2165161.1 unnamed protein product [Oppiella nova]
MATSAFDRHITQYACIHPGNQPRHAVQELTPTGPGVVFLKPQPLIIEVIERLVLSSTPLAGHPAIMRRVQIIQAPYSFKKNIARTVEALVVLDTHSLVRLMVDCPVVLTAEFTRVSDITGPLVHLDILY